MRGSRDALRVDALPDPNWYLDNVLVHAEPVFDAPLERGASREWQNFWQAQATELRGFVSRQGFVVTTSQLPLLGATRQSARTRIRRGQWTATGYGTVAPVDVRDANAHLERRRRHALISAAAQLRRSVDVVSGRSAAILHGVPTFAVPPQPELTSGFQVDLGRRGRVHVRGAGLYFDHVTTWFGTPVTTLPRTLVDLGRHDRRDAITAVDAAVHEGLVRPDAIDAALDDARGWPGVPQAREVLALAEPRTESPLESLTRLALHDDGFPMPEPQVWIRDMRVDFLWPELRLVLEVDGLEKYRDDALQREKKRERRLRRLGYRVERVTWDDVVSNWSETRVWLRGALRLPA